MAKYNQLEGSRYEGNEYPNMPSIDYGCSSYHITEKNYKDGCDWDKVKEICSKHGFAFRLVRCNYKSEITVVIYKKTDLDQDEYIRICKDYKNSEEDLQTFRKLIRSHDGTFYALHDCLHELDEETNLYFRCGWAGNVGLFGSHDVRRNVYSFADWLHTYKDLLNEFEPSLYDAGRNFDKGVYAYATANKFKIDESQVFADFTNEMALQVMREYKPELNFDVRTGKRQCDTDSQPYEAIVVSGSKCGQYGSFTINKDAHNIVYLSVRVPLAGEHSRRLTPQDYVKTIQDSIEFMLH